MRDFKKERGRNQQYLRMGLGIGGVVALSLVAVIAARGAIDMYGKFSEAAAAHAGAETQLADLQARYAQIKSDVDAYGSDRGLEAAVRERYGVVRPGEGAIDIVRHSSSTEPKAPPSGWWSKLWQALRLW